MKCARNGCRKDALKGERYCYPCRLFVLREMMADGYLTPLPQPPGRAQRPSDSSRQKFLIRKKGKKS